MRGRSLFEEDSLATCRRWQIMYDSMGSWQTVSYFNRVKHEQDRYSSAVKVHLQSQRIYTALAYFARATQSSVLSAGLLGACFLAAYQVVHGAQSIGSFVVLLTYWAQLSGPLTFSAQHIARFRATSLTQSSCCSCYNTGRVLQTGLVQELWFSNKARSNLTTFTSRMTLKDRP
jgi:ABC-type transport system involved in Fe-S cluster assembly fused permease/ATPase subunit